MYVKKWIFLFVLSISMASPLSDFSQKQLLLPPPPHITSDAYIVIDANTGAVLAERNAQKSMAPASLTKLMTSYIMFHALEQGHIHLDDTIHISTNAWKTEGSRLFLNENSEVNLELLLKGLIITSGNDASVALSEHFAGSENNFAIIMNRYAERLDLTHTHFINTTGLDHESHYTTAEDLATLSSHILKDFPQYFHWFHEQSITHNGITQNNRHNLLTTHPEIDGLKTGYTDKAGFCLATTAKRDNTRLIVVTLNAPSVKARNQDTLALLNYGFRFYETSLLYPKDTALSSIDVYLGLINNTDVVIREPFWATIPKGAREHLTIEVDIKEPLTAPLYQNKPIGHINAYLDDQLISQSPVYPKDDIQTSKGVSYSISNIKRFFKQWF